MRKTLLVLLLAGLLVLAIFASAVVVGACAAGSEETTTASSGGTTSAPIAVSTTSAPLPMTSSSSIPASTSTTQGAREVLSQVIGSLDLPPGAVPRVGVGVGPDGVPVVFHSDSAGWKLIFCEDWECSQRTTKVIDVGETLFLLPASIQFGADGLPVFTTPNTSAGAPMTIHACKDSTCTEAGRTEFPTMQGGWVSVAESGRTFIGVMNGEPMLHLFQAESPAGDSLREVASYPYSAASVKAGAGGDSFVILAERPNAGGSSDLSSVFIAECDLEGGDPAETDVGEIGIWDACPDPMTTPRGGTSAFLAGASAFGIQQLILVAWRGDPAQAVVTLLDDFPVEEGEIQGAAIAIGPSGRPVVVWNRVYYDRDLDEGTELFVARSDTPDCTSGTIATLFRGVEEASAGYYVDVAVGPDDNPILVYINWNRTTEENEITLTRCIDPAATTTAISVTTWGPTSR